jgi:RHS repeat-associated protein
LDGYAAPIKNDPSDLFCMDGKRLERVGSGAHGADGTEYRTLIDSFSRIRSRKEPGGGLMHVVWPSVLPLEPPLRGPDYFEVWTKDGRKLTYGKTTDSLIRGRNGIRVGWLLNRVEDRFGNSMVVRYAVPDVDLPPELADGVPNLVQPQSIFYTGHGSVEGNREVRFDYDVRQDGQVSFAQGGVPLVAGHRLSSVKTYVKGKPVKNYRLVYKSESVSQVVAIKECARDSDALCKPPTTFEYVEESGFTPAPMNYSVEDGGQLDMNGDGLPDFLVTIVHVGDVPANHWLTAGAVAADVAVTVTSYVLLTPLGGAAAGAVWGLIKGPLFGLLAAKPKVTFAHRMLRGNGGRGLPLTMISDIAGIPCATGNSVFMDYDQDGKDDIVSVCPPLNWVRAARSVGDGNFAPVGSGPLVTFPIPQPGAPALPKPILYDVNGDGLQDLVSCANPAKLEVRLRQNPESGFQATPVTLAGVNLYIPFCGTGVPTYRVLDVDGDGTPELLVRQPKRDLFSTYPAGAYALRFSEQSGSPTIWWQRVDFPVFGDAAYGKDMLLGDLNGDGLTDIWQTSGNVATIWRNTGRGFSPTFRNRSDPPWSSNPNARRDRTVLLDYDADGRLDILDHLVGADPARRYNVVTLLNGRLTQMESKFANDLLHFDPLSQGTFGGRYRMTGDADGDGNLDLFGEAGQLYYGSGLHNRLLSRVQDGLGNFVEIQYDQQAYTSTCGTGTQWPEKCLPRMNGLVSYHVEGFVADAAGNEIKERFYDYKYENGRVNLAGHGWLGFDKRTVVERVGTQQRHVAIEFEPVVRYTPQGLPTTSATWPYLYPLVGMPRTVTVDQYGAIDEASPLEDRQRARRNRTTNEWAVKLSDDGRPFQYLKLSRTESLSKPVPAVGESIPIEEQDGELRTSCIDNNYEVDNYGNVLRNYRGCGELDNELSYGGVDTATTFPIDRDQWTVSNPGVVTVTGTRGGSSKTRMLVHQYNAAGILTGVVQDPTGVVHHTTLTRDPQGYGTIERIREAEVSTEAPPPRVTDIVYDEDHIYPLLTKVYPTDVEETKALVMQTSYSEEFGKLATAADPNGVSVQNEFDAFGKTTKTVSLGVETVLDYAALPFSPIESSVGPTHPRLRLTSETTGSQGTFGGRSVQDLDNYGRVVRATSLGLDAQEVITEQVFDARGRVVATSAPHLAGAPVIPSTEIVYDYLDRVLQTIGSDGTVSERQYASGVSIAPAYEHWVDGCGGPGSYGCAVDVELVFGAHRSDEVAKQYVINRDFSGRVSRTLDGEHLDGSASSKFTYGPFDVPRTLEDNGGAVTSFDHDAYGRLLSHVDPDTGATANTYNAFGELRTTRHHSEVTGRTFAYDNTGRVTTITDSAGISTWVYDQGVNALGKLSETTSPPTMANPAGVRVSYGYEPSSPGRRRGLPVSATYQMDGASYTVGTSYDDLARVRDVTYPNAGTGNAVIARNHYHPASGALERVSEEGSGTSRPIWKVDAAFQGYLTAQETFGNGAVTTSGYDPDRHLLTSINTTLGGNDIQRLDYTHYGDGRIHERLGSSQTQEYDYDSLGRLKTLTKFGGGASSAPHGFGYDSHGNLTNNDTRISVYTTKPHLPDAVGGNTYTYYPNGNLLARIGPDVPGQTQTFQYTPFDLPKQVITGTATIRITQFEYTADEERVIRRDETGDRHFVGGLYQRLFSPTGETMEERFQLQTGTGTAEVVRANGVEKTLYMHADHLRTPDTISDSTGATLRQAYGPFGDLIGTPPGINQDPTRIGFTGHQQDNDLGLIDMGGRVYDPLAARFTTADPVMQAPYSTQGQNRYAYVFNDPINNNDPSGFVASGVSLVTGTNEISAGWGLLVTGPSPTAAATGVGSVAATGSTAAPFTAAGSGLGSAVGGLVNVGMTLALNPFGARDGYSYSGAAPSAAPTTNAHRIGGSSAAMNNHGGPPIVQEGGLPPGGLAHPLKPLLDQAARSPGAQRVGQWVQRGLDRYGPQAATLAKLYGARAWEMLKRVISGNVTIDPGKFDYLFGRVASNTHNLQRSLQNAAQLARIGFRDTPMSRALVDAHLKQVAKDPSNVVRGFENVHGQFVIRQSLLSGPRGHLMLESTWQILENGTQRLSTVIPFGKP